VVRWGHWDDGEGGGQSAVVVGVGGVEREATDDGDRGDHEVHAARSRLATGGQHHSGELAVAFGCRAVERQRPDPCLGVGEHLGAGGSVDGRPGQRHTVAELGQGDSADVGDIRKLDRVVSGQIDDHARVEQP